MLATQRVEHEVADIRLQLRQLDDLMPLGVGIIAVQPMAATTAFGRPQMRYAVGFQEHALVLRMPGLSARFPARGLLTGPFCARRIAGRWPRRIHRILVEPILELRDPSHCLGEQLGQLGDMRLKLLDALVGIGSGRHPERGSEFALA